MKRTITLLIATALILGMSQCKKKVETITPSNLGEAVHITVNVDDGGKHIVYPGTGAYVFEDGDKLYVGNNGKYVGTLTYADGAFSGDIYGPSTNDYLHFYFVGGLETTPNTLSAGTTSYTVSIADQSSKLPVLSYGRSTDKYTTSTATYGCTLLNKCGLVKFVPATATSAAIAVGDMKTTATIDFGTPGITPNGTTGAVTLYPESNSAKWAVLLPQTAVSNPAVTISGYASSITSVPEVTNNMYYNTGVSIAMVAAATVTTTSVTTYSNTSATMGGNVTSAGGGTVSERGVYYNTSSPAENGTKVQIGSGTGAFSQSVTGLTAGTTYYVKAYAVNENGMVYGSQVTFTTKSLPTVTTTAVSVISATGATSGGNVTSAGGGTVSARGVCWSTSANPTISNSHTTNGSGTGSFTSIITGLTANTTYHVRAYATNEIGTAYGADVTFRAASAEFINAPFTVASGTTVKFASGNLQYNKTTGKFSFMEHQYSTVETLDQYVGDDYANQNIVSLFGWGTSGYNNKYPYMTDTDDTNYGNGSSNIAGTNYDWGVYNKYSNQNNITDGGNHAWRTLTKDEWVYLFNTRTTGVTVNNTSNARYTQATINTDGTSVNGVILFPDNYAGGTPSGVTWGTINDKSSWGTRCTTAGWSSLEAAGCVFLPAAGYRSVDLVWSAGFGGLYWSSTCYDNISAYCMAFGSGSIYPEDANSRISGYSVRLVF